MRTKRLQCSIKPDCIGEDVLSRQNPSPWHDRDNVEAWYFQNTPDFVFRPLYRLDRDTTGALVLAKNKFAANAKLTKTYRAVCEGETPESGCVNVPIGLKPGHKVECKHARASETKERRAGRNFTASKTVERLRATASLTFI